MRTSDVVGAGGPDDRRHHGGRGLVVRPGVGVDARPRRRRLGPRARVAADHRGVVEPRRGGGRRGELRGELAEGQVLALLLDQPVGRDVPERRGAAVAEHDLVAVGQREQLGQPARTRPTRSRTGAWRCEVPISERPGRGERVEVRGLDLRRPGTEPPVGGQQVGGDLQRRSWNFRSGSAQSRTAAMPDPEESKLHPTGASSGSATATRTRCS